MKKFISITAIILVISVISTLCFGVALGSEFVDYAASGELDRAFEELEAKLDALDDGFFDNDYDTDFDDYDGALKGRVTVEPEEYGSESIAIGADSANVILMPSQDGKLSAEVLTYSKSGDSIQSASVLRDYSENGVDCNIYIKATETNALTEIKAIVYIPNTVKSVRFNSSVGALEADGGLVLDSLVANVTTGSVSLERASVGSCNITVGTGKIDIENGFSAGKDFKGSVATGKIECALSFADSYTVAYSARSCELDTDGRPIGLELFDENGNSTVNAKPSGKIVSAGTDENAVEVNLSVATGKIEFDTD